MCYQPSKPFPQPMGFGQFTAASPAVFPALKAALGSSPSAPSGGSGGGDNLDDILDTIFQGQRTRGGGGFGGGGFRGMFE